MTRMKKKPKPIAALAVILLLLSTVETLSAQTNQTASTAPAVEDTPLNLPQWVKDLRRGEIVLFGSFPFTFFTATFVMDTYRASQHNWDTRYAPWPLKSAGAINMTTDETFIVIGAAAAGAFLISIADFIIVQIKRSRAQKAAAALPAGEPIIIRKPWPPAEESPDAVEQPGDAGAGEVSREIEAEAH
jgi:hypothetical protein